MSRGIFFFFVAFGLAAQNVPSPNGIPGYLLTDGKQMTWSAIVTGGSGALDCVTQPGVCDIVTALVPLKAAANSWTGANDFSRARFLRLPSGAGIPREGCGMLSDVGKMFVRNDARAPNASLYLCAQTANNQFSWELAFSPFGYPKRASETDSEHPAIPAYTADGKELSNHVVTGEGRFKDSTANLKFQGSAMFLAVNYSCQAKDPNGNIIATEIIEKTDQSITLRSIAPTTDKSFMFQCAGR